VETNVTACWWRRRHSPSSMVLVIQVDPSVPGLDAIRAGDTVVTELTRAVAVSVKHL
jgi:hypothetical protein